MIAGARAKAKVYEEQAKAMRAALESRLLRESGTTKKKKKNHYPSIDRSIDTSSDDIVYPLSLP